MNKIIITDLLISLHYILRALSSHLVILKKQNCLELPRQIMIASTSRFILTKENNRRFLSSRVPWRLIFHLPLAGSLALTRKVLRYCRERAIRLLLEIENLALSWWNTQAGTADLSQLAWLKEHYWFIEGSATGLQCPKALLWASFSKEKLLWLHMCIF